MSSQMTDERYLTCQCGDLIAKRGEMYCAKCRNNGAPFLSAIGPTDPDPRNATTDNEKPPMSERVPCTECDTPIWAGETTGKCQRCDAKPDNWKHRSKGMKCSTCMWYAPKVSLEPGFKIGRCRKHAPTLNGWPVMVHNDWCGDHKLDEEKMT